MENPANTTKEKITTVCITTCNRPEQLGTCLSSLIKTLHRYERKPRILVIDDSENLPAMQKTKDILDSHAQTYGGKIESLNRTERKFMALELARTTNIPQEIVDFAILGDKLSTTTAGACRNASLIKTRGEKILMLDDDVVCNFISPAHEQPPYFTIENPNEYWFLKNGEVPSAQFSSAETDFLTSHESMLGSKSFQDLEILDTYMGAYGDSPAASHIPLLLLPQVQEKVRTMTADEYHAAKETRRIILGPIAPIAYQGPICISMAMGIDNRKTVPPFAPVGRAQDFIFGMTRWKAFPSKVSFYIPQFIEHERPSGEARTLEYNAVSEMTKMNRVMGSFINEVSITDTDPRINLQRIGEKFLAITQEPPLVFRLLLEAQYAKIAQGVIQHVTMILETSSGMPGFWVDDMERILNSFTPPDPKSMMTDVTKSSQEDGVFAFQNWMRLYGQLLQNWYKLN